MSFFQQQNVEPDETIIAYEEEEIEYTEGQEFLGFEELTPEQQEYQVGFHHQQQMGILPVYDRESMYLIELYRELEQYFSSNTADFYKETVEKQIPRYWTKNASLLAYAINMYHFTDKLDKTTLLTRAKSIRTQPATLLRYYYMVQKFIPKSS